MRTKEASLGTTSLTRAAASAPSPDADSPPSRENDNWLLRLEDVKFQYPNGLKAIDGFDLEIADGEVLALVGPSGCGKSTIISLIAGLIEGSGNVRWNGDRLDSQRSKARRRLNVVFQKNTVMPWLTVEKNVKFGFRYLDVPKDEAQSRVDSLLEMAGLTEFRNSYPSVLSGGMLRRVALLSGIATYPQLLILDEPFSALDEPTRIGIHAELLQIVRRLNMTVLLITHDLGEAISLADRVGVLTTRPGRIAEVHDIPLGRDRDMTTVRTTDEYQSSYQRLWQALWAQIGPA